MSLNKLHCRPPIYYSPPSHTHTHLGTLHHLPALRLVVQFSICQHFASARVQQQGGGRRAINSNGRHLGPDVGRERLQQLEEGAAAQQDGHLLVGILR